MRRSISKFASWLVLAVCLSLTLVAWNQTQNWLYSEKQARFNSHVRQVKAAIIDRIEVYIDVHYSGVGLFTSSGLVTRNEWRKFIENMHILDRYPGINGIGHAVPVLHKDLANFIQETRKDNVPNFNFRPSGNRSDYFIIKYIEPIEMNGPALGFDMGSEQTRRKAMEIARDTGKPTISGKVILVQDQGHTPGFLLYVPFYQSNGLPATTKERQKLFRGWIYAPFIVKNFIDGIYQHSLSEIKDEIAIEIANDPSFSTEQMLYQSPNLSETTKTQFQTLLKLNIHGQNWMVHVKATDHFYNLTTNKQPLLVLLGGGLLSLILFAFVHFMARAHDYAVELATNMTQELKNANERLLKVDRIKDEFLANTSHELRTPLNGIIGIAESMIDGALGRLTPEQKNNLLMISASGRRLASLINDILDFSKLKNHEIELKIRPVDMHSLVEVVLKLSQMLVQGKDLRLINAVPPDVPAVAGDENRIQQILYNLVGNAIKFTPHGSVTISTKFTAGSSLHEKKDQATLEIAVADTGIGIRQDKIAHIFESFEQGEGSIEREYGGTGLGLAITKQLLALQGGKIWVDSTFGEGSTFSFTLPLASAFSTEELVSASSPVIDTTIYADFLTQEDKLLPRSAPSLPEALILVVDDEPINLQVLGNYLSFSNYAVVQSINGLDALDLIENDLKPDLVLLDVMMPRMSGYEVCRQLREKYPLAELPILMLTAKNQAKDVVAGFEAGANDYLTKPIDKNELLARINTLLTLKRAIKLQNHYLIVQQELAIAHNIQLNLLPEDHPHWAEVDIVCYSTSAKEVGGDFYAYYTFDSANFGIAVGDVSGKGMPAALLMAVSLASFQAVVEQIPSPSKLLGHLDRALKSYTKTTHQNCAFIYAKIMRPSEEQSVGELRVANAGCIAPLIKRRDASVEWIDVVGIPLGVGLGWEMGYQEATKVLRKGEMLIFTSDGVVEAKNLTGEMFGFGRLEETVLAGPQTNATAMLDHIRAEVEAFVGKRQPHDDLTVVILKF